MAADVVTAPSNPSILGNPATLQSWSNLIDSLFGTSTQTNTSTQSGSAADPAIMQLLAQLMGTSGEGANQANIMALLAPIFAQFKEGALPQIQQFANAGGGVYNSTTQGLLANDALARAVAQGGGAVVAQQNNRQDQLAKLLQILAVSTKSTNQQQTASKSGSGGNAAKAGLGAAAGAALAKALQKKPGTSNRANTPEDYEQARANADEISAQNQSQNSGEQADIPGDMGGGVGSDNLGFDFASWDSGNSPEDSGWDFLDLGADPGAGNGSWDFIDSSFGDGADISGDMGGGGGSFFGGDSSGDTFDLFASET